MRTVAMLLVAALVAGSLLSVVQAGDRKEPSVIPPGSDMTKILRTVLGEFPGAYEDLSHVTYIHVEGQFTIDRVTFLIPEKKIQDITKKELKARACRAKNKLVLDCACEEVELGKAKTYAWHKWSDKRVVPVTVDFAIGC